MNALLLLTATAYANSERVGVPAGPELEAAAVSPYACAAVVGLWIAGVGVTVVRHRKLQGR